VAAFDAALSATLSRGYEDFIRALYAVTHVVYTLNGYSTYKLSPRWLPEEFEFLKASLADLIKLDDADAVGEMLDLPELAPELGRWSRGSRQ
jgi:hypothetical protein